jgi:hypothetical protein
MTSYRDKHHKVPATLACEAWTEHKRSFIIRLKICPNERKSSISTNLINEANGECQYQPDSTIKIWLKPGRGNTANKSVPTYSINFTSKEPGYFLSVNKRELPNTLATELKSQFQIADEEILQK